jgi:hypothetical protein
MRWLLDAPPAREPAARNGRSVVIVAVDSRLRPGVLDDAVCDVVRANRETPASLSVLVPLVLHSTLPITACPPRIAARLERLRLTASETMGRLGLSGRAEIAPCRGVPALLHALPHPDVLVLVGRAGWSVRRAARGAAEDIVIFPAPAERAGERHHHVPRLRPAG